MRWMMMTLGLLAAASIASAAQQQQPPPAGGSEPSAAPQGTGAPGTASEATPPQTAPAPGTTAQEPTTQGTQGTMGEAHAGMEHPMSKADQPYEATKHVAVLNAALMDAANNAQMLKQISQDPKSYDQDHGRVFLTNIRTAVMQADEHLKHLRGIASGSRDLSKLQDLQARLDRARDMIPRIEGELDNPARLTKDAGMISDQMRAGLSPLKDVSKSMRARIDFKSAG